MGKAVTVQNARFAFGDDDGAESAHSLDTENTNRTAQIGDVVYMLRIQIEETGGGAEVSGYEIYAQKNGAGGFLSVPYSATNNGIRLDNDTQSRADDEATTERLTAGAGTWQAGKYDDGSAAVGTGAITIQSQYTDLEFAVKIDTANAANDDYWEFRVVFSGGVVLDSYPGTYPTVTADIGYAPLVATYKGFGLTGQASGLAARRTMAAGHTAFALSGFAAGFARTYAALSAAYGSFALTGYATGFAARRTMAAAYTSFAFTGFDTALQKKVTLTAEYGAFRLLGGGEIARVTFEQNDLSEFDHVFNPDDDLTVSGAAAMVGNYGLEVLIDDQVNVLGYFDITPPPTNEIYSKIRIDPNGLTMADGDQFVFTSIGSSLTPFYLGVLQLGRNASSYYIQSRCFEDDANSFYGNDNISDAAHVVEMHLERASSAIASDGRMRVWIDGELVQTFPDLDNWDMYAGVYRAAMGAFGGAVDVGTSGTFYLDRFIVAESRTELLTSRFLEAGQGGFSFAGQLAGLAKVFTLAAENKSFAFAGYSTGLAAHRTLAAVFTSFTLTGIAAGLDYSGAGAHSPLVAAYKGFTFSGRVSGFAAHRTIATAYNAFAFTGQDADLLRRFTLTAGQGGFSYTGQATGLLVRRLLALQHVSFALTGQGAGLVYSGEALLLVATVGIFAMLGFDAHLTHRTPVQPDVVFRAVKGRRTSRPQPYKPASDLKSHRPRKRRP